ncbi:hypothetical protein TIFTF001_028404 [Ficus carica]|uniref:Uncharacterized protein n=1 Tax=Ficus carica TaxID=3494 RepID=A0AA88J1F3_FICCA|nr:hypothetical protein TIFTF001_028404 [Ficus carica]
MADARPISPISSCLPKAAIGSPTPVSLTANSQSRTRVRSLSSPTSQLQIHTQAQP